MKRKTTLENKSIDITTITIQDMPGIAKDIVMLYCEDNCVDETDIYPSIWNDILTELQIQLFRPCNKILKLKDSVHNDYDRSAVYFIYEHVYKRLCNSHCQEISLKGFTEMIGIPKQTIYNWANDDKYFYNDNGIEQASEYVEPSSLRFDFHEKIMEDNEESLFALMKDRRYNPMKLLPKLNKVHGWNMGGVSGQATQRAQLLDKLPRIGVLNCAGNTNNFIESKTKDADENV